MSLAAYDELLLNLAARCHINKAKTLRKSKELINLLNSKHSLNLSETTKVIACLEIAAGLTSVDFNRDVAVKFSGCSKRNYVNNLNNISKLLNLDKIFTIKEICLIIGTPQVCDDSLSLFKRYKAMHSSNNSNLEHPMYGCAAILTVCKQKRYSLNLSKLVELSRIKKTDLKKLSNEFSKLYEKKALGISKMQRKTEKCLDTEIQRELNYCREIKNEQMSDEKFKDWKRKMLEDD